MKKIIFILLSIISIGVYGQPCSGVTGIGTTKTKTFVSCYDTVKVHSVLNTVHADTVDVNKMTVNGLGSGIPKITSGVFGLATPNVDYITPGGSIAGNAATASQLQTARNINGVSFNGTADITVPGGTGSTGMVGYYSATNTLGGDTLFEKTGTDPVAYLSVGFKTPVTALGNLLHIYNQQNTGTAASNTSLILQSFFRNTNYYSLVSSTGAAGWQVMSNDRSSTYGSFILSSTAGVHDWAWNLDGTTTNRINSVGFGIGSSTPNAQLDMNGNVSTTNTTTNGVRIRMRPVRVTNTTSSGTVTAYYVNVFGGDTLAATSSTTYSTAVGAFFKPNVAGNNVTISGNRAIGSAGDLEFTAGRIRFLSGTTGGIGTVDAFPFTIRTSNTDRINILSGGQTGIGITAPTPNSDLHVGGSFALPYAAKTTTYTISATDHTIDCTSGTFDVTLPTAASITGRIYVVSNTGAGVITLKTTSSQTINGSTTQTIAAGGGYIVQSNGSNWTCIGKW